MFNSYKNTEESVRKNNQLEAQLQEHNLNSVIKSKLVSLT